MNFIFMIFSIKKRINIFSPFIKKDYMFVIE